MIREAVAWRPKSAQVGTGALAHLRESISTLANAGVGLDAQGIEQRIVVGIKSAGLSMQFFPRPAITEAAALVVQVHAQRKHELAVKVEKMRQIRKADEDKRVRVLARQLGWSERGVREKIEADVRDAQRLAALTPDGKL
jgi:hypothetical protein